MKRMMSFAIAMSVMATTAQAQNCDAGLRSFTDDRGVAVCIPENPQRIVTTLDEAIFVPLYELGVTPVGTTGSSAPDGTNFIRGGRNNVGVDFDTADDVDFIGNYEFIDYEAIAALNPDLIIVGRWGEWFNGDVGKFGLIAPTITINIEERTGLATHDYLADVTGTQDALAQVKARYDYQIDTLRKVVPEGQSANFSVEALQEFDADWVFLSYANQSGEGPADAIANMNALFPGWCDALTACQQGRVMPVPIVEAASWSTDAFFATTLMLIGTMGNPLNYD